MKPHVQLKMLRLGALMFSIILVAGFARAATVVQTVTQSGADANGWASAIWGTPAAIALSTNDYLSPSGFFVPTPNNNNPAAFAGATLTISNGTFYLKNNNVAAIVNLTL